MNHRRKPAKIVVVFGEMDVKRRGKIEILTGCLVGRLVGRPVMSSWKIESSWQYALASIFYFVSTTFDRLLVDASFSQ